MTKQEIFNKVWDHYIVKKSPPGVDPTDGKCRYRTPEGNVCAVGLFLTEEEATKVPVSAVPAEEEISLFPPVVQENWQFFLQLQGLHDTSAAYYRREFYTRLEEGLRALALQYQLTVRQEGHAA